jgi:hypothetical protein
MCSRLRLRERRAAARFLIKRSCLFAWAVSTASDWGFSSGIKVDLTMTGLERAKLGVNAGMIEGRRRRVGPPAPGAPAAPVALLLAEGAGAREIQGERGGDCLMNVS